MVVLLFPDFGVEVLQYEVEFALGIERFSGRLIPVPLRRTKGYPWILDEPQMSREHNPCAAGRVVVQILSQAVNAPETSLAL